MRDTGCQLSHRGKTFLLLRALLNQPLLGDVTGNNEEDISSFLPYCARSHLDIYQGPVPTSPYPFSYRSRPRRQYLLNTRVNALSIMRNEIIDC